MKPSARSLIHDEVMAEYEAPRPGLAERVLRNLPQAGLRPARRPGHATLQTLAVVVAALVVALAMVGIRAAKGDLALPAGLPLGIGGLHPPAASYFIADAQFLSADTAWIMAQLHEHNGPTVFMKTTDAGRTWQEIFRIPDGSSGSLHFWNARDGELTEMVPSTLPPTKTPGAPGSSNMVPRFYRTQDGGIHWRLVDRPVDWAATGAQSYFLDQQQGWRIVPSLAGRTSSGGTVQRTQDGGEHWTTVGAVPAGASLGSNLTFTDQQTGWLTANGSKSYAWDAQGHPLPFAAPAALLYVTRDGGRTWAPVDLPLPAEAAANDVRLESPVFFGGLNGLLELEVMGPAPTFQPEGAGKPAEKGWMHSYVVTTSDGGRQWSAAMRTPGGLQEGGAFFFDARHWLMASGPDLSETMDGGRTWTTRQVLADGLAFSLAPWNYIDARTIWSQVGPDRLVRSTDGGAHWTSVTPPAIDR